jgi:hypothetical protein
MGGGKAGAFDAEQRLGRIGGGQGHQGGVAKAGRGGGGVQRGTGGGGEAGQWRLLRRLGPDEGHRLTCTMKLGKTAGFGLRGAAGQGGER